MRKTEPFHENCQLAWMLGGQILSFFVRLIWAQDMNNGWGDITAGLHTICISRLYRGREVRCEKLLSVSQCAYQPNYLSQMASVRFSNRVPILFAQTLKSSTFFFRTGQRKTIKLFDNSLVLREKQDQSGAAGFCMEGGRWGGVKEGIHKRWEPCETKWMFLM